MAAGQTALLLAVDHVQEVVAQEFSSRYCPHGQGIFLTRLCVFFVVFVAAGASLYLAGIRRRRRGLAYSLQIIAAFVLLAFAIGGGGFVLYGLSGCTGPAAEGLIWDWP